ncbi:MAG: serine protease [Deltaproteobacteria bacterium]|nr:serine protease [Deltaproteobacteria bacterium]MDZ4341798.1 serine protease [Candidatus Binatia bacterium]
MITIVLGLLATANAATRREVFSNSAVHLSFICGKLRSSGSGFIFFRPADPAKANEPNVSGQVFLVTNKHVLPPEGTECKIAMRVTTTLGGSPSTKTIDMPIVGADGKYLNTVRLHPDNDVAAVSITRDIYENKIKPEFVFTNLLGTKDKLKNDAGLVGDEIYILGYPGGLFDERNAYPIWRIGIIATSPLLGYAFPDALQKTWKLPSYVDGFLIDAHVYPGSSGSVVVVKPQAISFDSPSGILAGGPRSITYVLGIVSSSIPVVDDKLRLVTRMGLGIVQSADAVNATIEAFFKK